jgi:hypothetical protein
MALTTCWSASHKPGTKYVTCDHDKRDNCRKLGGRFSVLFHDLRPVCVAVNEHSRRPWSFTVNGILFFFRFLSSLYWLG